MGCSLNRQKLSDGTLNQSSLNQYRNEQGRNCPQQPFVLIKINDKKTQPYSWGNFNLRPISTSTIIRRRNSTTQHNSIQA